MWRRSNLPGIPDPDQSLSEEEEEEEDINVSFGENDMWPIENAKEEGGLLLQTKLEELIGCGELDYAAVTGDVSLEAAVRKITSSLEDDVVPDSQEDSCFPSERKAGLTCISAQEDDEVTIQDDEIPPDEPVTTWSTISKETKSLIHLDGIASSHSSAFKTKRVVKDNVKPKFSFHSHAHGETSFKISDMAEKLEPAADMDIEEDPIAECPHDFDEISDNRQGVAASKEVRNGFTEETISKLLDLPTNKIRAAKRSAKSYCRGEIRSWKFAHKGSSSILQDSATDDELPGPMDSGSSTDDEPCYQSSVANISNQKKQFVGDRFDEAIKASTLSKESLLFGSPKLSSGSSLYGKLQQIVKQEKETEMEITKKLQSGIGQADSSSYMDVRILSQHLEAKLVVCKCSVIDLPGDSLLSKNTQALVDKETETTVIFSPKVCTDVEIEMGSYIRLYVPWKEMEVKKTNEVIILSSYFSNM